MTQTTTMPARNVRRVALIVGAILLIPLGLTLLNSNASIYGGPGGGWDWMPGDFVVMGALLFAAGMAIDIVNRKLAHSAYKVPAIIAILATLFIIWIQLAVQAVSQLVAFLFF